VEAVGLTIGPWAELPFACTGRGVDPSPDCGPGAGHLLFNGPHLFLRWLLINSLLTIMEVTTFLNDGTLRFYEEIILKLIHSENAFIEKLEQMKGSFLHYWTELDNFTELCAPCTESTHLKTR
jgi:hypothetical protein